ncbi:MAG: bifunctional transaldolase/phosoglucose isomerase [Syntrophaceae bacterium]|nr:bifunctional transaldolase/phosoglucose isomerase [Syntrophaceae bacterium]
MNTIKDVNRLGQSIWLDFIRRSLLDSGELEALVARGVSGVTSNPTIFEKAIAGSADYDGALRELAAEGKTNEEIYLALALDDIRRAADCLRPVWEATGGADGYVSLEANPKLARDTGETVAEARTLFKALDRPNVMIKIPATPEGIPAVEALIGLGVNVNVTLIFSLAHYEAAVRAYIAGLEQLAARGGDLRRVASVASFFVSRIDTAVDRRLEALGDRALQGKAAIACAKLAYSRFRAICAWKRWKTLAAKGARVQRLLWGSTGTKNPLYPDTLYVDGLIGPDTVNTLPPATLEAFLDHGKVAPTLCRGVREARRVLDRIESLGIRMDEIAEALQREGVLAFETSFDALMGSIRSKRDELRAGWMPESTEAGSLQDRIDEALAELRKERVMGRIWAKDHTVWKPDPREIANRLGWLSSPSDMVEHVDDIEAFAKEIRSEGFTRVLLLGMGGSSLAPEVFAKTFGSAPGCPRLSILDSTDPGAVLRAALDLDADRTLFIVSSKSGTTVEVLSLFTFFHRWAVERLGRDRAGRHFAAVTDPGSALEGLAREHGFRRVFLNDPNIGGRFSALSFFGLVPAALIGVDVRTILGRAATMAANCDAGNCPVAGDNRGARLGAYLGRLAQLGRDKLTLITSPSLQHFGDWVEQLVAESTGKEGKGILPVLREAPGRPEVYGADRLFVGLEAAGEPLRATFIRSLEDAGHPVEIIRVRDPVDLGGQFFLWMMATAVAGRFLGVNPFDQPDVEAAKAGAREAMEAFRTSGRLPHEEPSLRFGGIEVYGPVKGADTMSALESFLEDIPRGGYISIMAWLPPTDETDVLLQIFRTRLRDRYRVPVTVGYGPRFLHSTGQLHKGDGGRGVFIQLTADFEEDVPIPDGPGATAPALTFGILEAAQAAGDRQALLARGRRVMRLHLGPDIGGRLALLTEGIQ